MVEQRKHVRCRFVMPPRRKPRRHSQSRLCAFRASKATIPWYKRPPVSPQVRNDPLKFLSRGVALRPDERGPVLAATGKPMQQKQGITASVHLKVDRHSIQHFDSPGRSCRGHSAAPLAKSVPQTKNRPRHWRERSISFYFISHARGRSTVCSRRSRRVML